MKVIVCKHENLTSSPQNPYKKEWVAHISNPNTPTAKVGEFLGAYRPDNLAYAVVNSLRLCLKQSGMQGPKLKEVL